MTTLYCAHFVLPSASPQIEDGAVAVEGTRIIAVGARRLLVARFPQAQIHDYGRAAILPGLINCHSHLELTAMRGYLEREESDFTAWLKKLTLARLELMTPDDIYVSAVWGAVEAARAGITCAADASDTATASLRALADVGLRGIVYQESFGPDPQLARENLEKLRDKLALLRGLETGLVRAGVSPHSPYTVSAQQLELLADLAISEKLPLMMHAAESEYELLFMKEGRGPFADGLARRGIEWRAPGVSTIEHLNEHGVLLARPLLAHCVRVDDRDMETIKETGASIAHCPKSNAKLGHGRAPFAEFLRRELAVGFGSDSVASNNTCDILEEARFAILMSRACARHEDKERPLSAHDALKTATLGGARALGLEDKLGALAEGLEADLTIISLEGAHQLPIYDPADALIFASTARDVLLTVVRGREIFRDGRVTTVDEDSLRARLLEIRDKLSRPLESL